MTITSPVRRIRIVSPLTRARDDATVADLQPDDIVKFLDTPIYQVDPVTRSVTDVLKQFKVGHGGALSIYR